MKLSDILNIISHIINIIIFIYFSIILIRTNPLDKLSITISGFGILGSLLVSILAAIERLRE